MYSLSCRSFMFIRRCPLTQMTSVSRYTYSNLMTNSVKIVGSVPEKKRSQEDFFQRTYASVGGKRNKDFNLPNVDFTSIVNQSKQLLKEVQLSDVAKAPQPYFWYGIGGLIPFVLPPISFVLFGYSPFLAGAQLAYGATICSFVGGVKWGYSMTQKSSASWESLGWCVGPQLVAWLSLLMPQTLGFIVVGGSLLAQAFVDLTTVNYPEWFRAMRLGLTIPAVLTLLLTALMCLFN